MVSISNAFHSTPKWTHCLGRHAQTPTTTTHTHTHTHRCNNPTPLPTGVQTKPVAQSIQNSNGTFQHWFHLTRFIYKDNHRPGFVGTNLLGSRSIASRLMFLLHTIPHTWLHTYFVTFCNHQKYVSSSSPCQGRCTDIASQFTFTIHVTVQPKFLLCTKRNLTKGSAVLAPLQ